MSSHSTTLAVDIPPASSLPSEMVLPPPRERSPIIVLIDEEETSNTDHVVKPPADPSITDDRQQPLSAASKPDERGSPIRAMSLGDAITSIHAAQVEAETIRMDDALMNDEVYHLDAELGRKEVELRRLREELARCRAEHGEEVIALRREGDKWKEGFRLAQLRNEHAVQREAALVEKGKAVKKALEESQTQHAATWKALEDLRRRHVVGAGQISTPVRQSADNTVESSPTITDLQRENAQLRQYGTKSHAQVLELYQRLTACETALLAERANPQSVTELTKRCRSLEQAHLGLQRQYSAQHAAAQRTIERLRKEASNRTQATPLPDDVIALRQRLTTIEAELATELATAKEKRNEALGLMQALTEARHVQADLRREMAAVVKVAEERKKEFEEVRRALMAENEGLKADVVRLGAEVKTNSADGLAEVTKLQQELRDRKSVDSHRDGQLEWAQADASTWRQKCEALKRSIDAAAQKEKRLVKDHQLYIEELQDEIKTLTDPAQRIRLELENAFADRLRSLQTQVAASKNDLRKQQDEMRKQQTEMRKQQDETRKQLDMRTAVETKLRESEDRVGTLQRKRESLGREIISPRDEVSKKAAQALVAASELAESRQQVEALQTGLNALRAKLDQFLVDNRRLKKDIDEWRGAKVKVEPGRTDSTAPRLPPRDYRPQTDARPRQYECFVDRKPPTGPRYQPYRTMWERPSRPRSYDTRSRSPPRRHHPIDPYVKSPRRTPIESKGNWAENERRWVGSSVVFIPVLFFR
jgi:chromosome segregation ATPase